MNYLLKYIAFFFLILNVVTFFPVYAATYTTSTSVGSYTTMGGSHVIDRSCSLFPLIGMAMDTITYDAQGSAVDFTNAQASVTQNGQALSGTTSQIDMQNPQIKTLFFRFSSPIKMNEGDKISMNVSGVKLVASGRVKLNAMVVVNLYGSVIQQCFDDYGEVYTFTKGGTNINTNTSPTIGNVKISVTQTPQIKVTTSKVASPEPTLVVTKQTNAVLKKTVNFFEIIRDIFRYLAALEKK